MGALACCGLHTTAGSLLTGEMPWPRPGGPDTRHVSHGCRAAPGRYCGVAPPGETMLGAIRRETRPLGDLGLTNVIRPAAFVIEVSEIAAVGRPREIKQTPLCRSGGRPDRRERQVYDNIIWPTQSPGALQPTSSVASRMTPSAFHRSRSRISQNGSAWPSSFARRLWLTALGSFCPPCLDLGVFHMVRVVALLRCGAQQLQSWSSAAFARCHAYARVYMRRAGPVPAHGVLQAQCDLARK